MSHFLFKSALLFRFSMLKFKTKIGLLSHFTEYDDMNMLFAETLKKMRSDNGLSQRELAALVYVSRPTVARWENGSRLPDAVMISRLAGCLGVDVNLLLTTVAESDESPNIIMVEDSKIILSGALPVLEEVMPYASITGFTRPSEAIEYAKSNRVALAFLDIELGKTSGFDLCNTLLALNPRTNVVFLTAYSNYSLDAWNTGASGFMLKPITGEGVLTQLKHLRYPFFTGGGSE